MKYKDNVGAFVVLTRKKRSEVFLVKRSDFPVWEPQGGRVEKGETPEQCAIREAYEETGFKIKIIRKVAEYINPKSGHIESHVFEGRYISGKFKKEYPECQGGWYGVKKLPIKMMAVRKMMINDCLSDKEGITKRPNVAIVTPYNFHLFLLMPVSCIRFLIKRLNSV